jgi:integrase
MKATLYYVCKTETGWKRYPAVNGRNNRIRPRYAMVAGVPTSFDVGHYEVRTVERGKTRWQNVGEMASEAESQRENIEKRGDAQEAAHEAGAELKDAGERINLQKAADEFYEHQIAAGHKAAGRIFRTVFNEFFEGAKVKYADEVSRGTIDRWYTALREKGNSERTLNNKHISLFSLFNHLGIATKPLAKGSPKFTQAEVEIYTDDQIKAIFGAVDDPYYRLVFTVLLKTGLRKEEAATLCWTDIDFGRKTLTLKAHPELNFFIKDRAGRKIPLPDDLIEMLKAWHKSHPGRLVLGTVEDTVHTGWLDSLKRSAKVAGLNCGHCRGCKETGNCDQFFLHKFRATCITKWLRKLRDPRTVMQFSGHSDLKSILRYLRADDAEEMQAAITSIDWGD